MTVVFSLGLLLIGLARAVCVCFMFWMSWPVGSVESIQVFIVMFQFFLKNKSRTAVGTIDTAICGSHRSSASAVVQVHGHISDQRVYLSVKYSSRYCCTKIQMHPPPMGRCQKRN